MPPVSHHQQQPHPQMEGDGSKTLNLHQVFYCTTTNISSTTTTTFTTTLTNTFTPSPPSPPSPSPPPPPPPYLPRPYSPPPQTYPLTKAVVITMIWLREWFRLTSKNRKTSTHSMPSAPCTGHIRHIFQNCLGLIYVHDFVSFIYFLIDIRHDLIIVGSISNLDDGQWSKCCSHRTNPHLHNHNPGHKRSTCRTFAAADHQRSTDI